MRRTVSAHYSLAFNILLQVCLPLRHGSQGEVCMAPEQPEAPYIEVPRWMTYSSYRRCIDAYISRHAIVITCCTRVHLHLDEVHQTLRLFFQLVTGAPKTIPLQYPLYFRHIIFSTSDKLRKSQRATKPPNAASLQHLLNASTSKSNGGSRKGGCKRFIIHLLTLSSPF
jgi:hypothetical protein